MRRLGRMKAILFALLAAAVPAQAQRGFPLVTLELRPGQTLPGIPVTAVVTLTNPGDAALEVAGDINVSVAPSEGEPFYATDDTTSSPRASFRLSSGVGTSISLAPRQTRTFTMPADLVSQPEFFVDERLSSPGTYRLRIKVWSGPGAARSATESNEATLTVLAPEREDAIVWNRMLELSGGGGWNLVDWVHFGPALAKEAFAIAPSSRYIPYLASFKWGQTAEQHREAIEHAMCLRPEGPIADQLEGVLAAWLMERGEEALGAGDLERALALFGDARIRAMDLKRTTDYPWIRENVERWLSEELDTDAVLRARFAANVQAMSSFIEAITPFVECVDPGSAASDPYIVWFGYENPNRGAKFIERGKGNDLTPSAAKVQPRVFQPGRQRYGFSITTHAERVLWNVDGKTATASRGTQPRCTYPDAETVGIRPVVECVEQDGRNVVITFGYENPAAVAVRIAGEDNRLTGSTSRPPEIFEPGRHHGVMRVKASDGETVSWTVAGRTASASPPPSGCATSPR